jgi:hypothetical protein
MGRRPRRADKQRKAGTLSGAAKGCFVWIQEPCGSGWSFPMKQNLTRMSHQIVNAATFRAAVSVRIALQCDECGPATAPILLLAILPGFLAIATGAMEIREQTKCSGIGSSTWCELGPGHDSYPGSCPNN